MSKQIPGQLNMIDFMPDKTGYSIGDVYRSEGYINAYDQMPDHPCEVDVIDHNGNRFKSVVTLSFGSMVFDTNKYGDRGYDICWWREVKTRKKCGSCAHLRHGVTGLMEYHVYMCTGYDDHISRSSDPEQAACDHYQPKGDCSTCAYRCWLHRDGKTYQGCEYYGGCGYKKREEAIDGQMDH